MKRMFLSGILGIGLLLTGFPVQAGEPQNVDLSKIDTQQLEATAYRLIVQLNNNQAILQAINQELARRAALPQPTPTPKKEKMKHGQ